jgi:anti-sigma28 factor (negative regulator of flagellin synthesis)
MMIKNAGFPLSPLSDIRLQSGNTQETSAKQHASFASALQQTGAARTDTIELTQHADDGSAVLGEALSTVVDQLNKDADPAWLEQLKSNISAGSYPFSSEGMARILLLDE